MVNIGDTAPAFTLKTTDKSDISLADYSGQTVILAFYPGAFTGVCDKEMCAFQDNIGKLNQSNAVVLGIEVVERVILLVLYSSSTEELVQVVHVLDGTPRLITPDRILITPKLTRLGYFDHTQ